MNLYDFVVTLSGKNANEDAQLVIPDHPRPRLVAMSIEDTVPTRERSDFGYNIRELIR